MTRKVNRFSEAGYASGFSYTDQKEREKEREGERLRVGLVDFPRGTRLSSTEHRLR